MPETRDSSLYLCQSKFVLAQPVTTEPSTATPIFYQKGATYLVSSVYRGLGPTKGPGCLETGPVVSGDFQVSTVG